MRLKIRELQRLWRFNSIDLAPEMKLVAGEAAAATNPQYWASWVAMNSFGNQARDDTFVILATVVIRK